MTEKARNGAQQQYPEAPRGIKTRYGLVPQPHHKSHIDTEEPQVARKAVEQTPYQRLLASKTRHLTIRRVTEIGKHQQQHATDI